MKQARMDLLPLNVARAKALREASYRFSKHHEFFWDELESILESEGYELSPYWEELDHPQKVGDVWKQSIGEFQHDKTVHKFTYLYVGTAGLAIDTHGHNKVVHEGSQVKKTSELYVFPNGKVELCRKDEEHKLVNDFGEPIYVLAVKVTQGKKPKPALF